MSEIRYTLRQLEYFLAVAETGTLKAAAQRCHISQVGIGTALAALEKSLDVQLLIRKRAKGIILTPEGRNLLRMVRSIVTQATKLQEEAQCNADEVVGNFRIGCHASLCNMFMPEICDTFAKRHPLLDINFIEGTHQELQKSLLSGQIEVALLYDRALSDDLDRLSVMQLPPYALVPAGHPLAGRKGVHLRELHEDPLIRLDIPPMTHGVKNWPPDSLAKNARYSTSSIDLVHALVGRGLGYAILAQRIKTQTTNEDQKVRAIKILDDTPPIQIVLAYPRGVELPLRALTLAQFLGAINAPHTHEEETSV